MEHITIDPAIRFGKPCVEGTRIAVEDVLQWLKSGMSVSEITADYPELSDENIDACLSFAGTANSQGTS